MSCLICSIGCSTKTVPTKIEIPDYLAMPEYEQVIECIECTDEQIFNNVGVMLENFAKCKARHEALLKIIEAHNEGME